MRRTMPSAYAIVKQLLLDDPLVEPSGRHPNILGPDADCREDSAPGQLVGIGTRDAQAVGDLGDGEEPVLGLGLGLGRRSLGG
jgi:hypothetical protein